MFNDYPQPITLADLHEFDFIKPYWKGYVADLIAVAEEENNIEEARCLQFDRKCFLTGKKLFFKKSVRLSVEIPAKLTWPSQSYIDHEVWISRNEYLLLKFIT